MEQPHLNLSEANSPSPSPVGSLQGIYLRLFSNSVAKTKAVNSRELCYPDNVHNFDLRLTGSEGILESPLTHYPPGLLCDGSSLYPRDKALNSSSRDFSWILVAEIMWKLEMECHCLAHLWENTVELQFPKTFVQVTVIVICGLSSTLPRIMRVENHTEDSKPPSRPYQVQVVYLCFKN